MILPKYRVSRFSNYCVEQNMSTQIERHKFSNYLFAKKAASEKAKTRNHCGTLVKCIFLFFLNVKTIFPRDIDNFSNNL